MIHSIPFFFRTTVLGRTSEHILLEYKLVRKKLSKGNTFGSRFDDSSKASCTTHSDPGTDAERFECIFGVKKQFISQIYKQAKLNSLSGSFSQCFLV